MKLDTIEKHAGNIYVNQIENGEEKSITKCKYSEECQHVKYQYEYDKYLISRIKLEASGGLSHLYLEKKWKEIYYPRRRN